MNFSCIYCYLIKLRRKIKEYLLIGKHISVNKKFGYWAQETGMEQSLPIRRKKKKQGAKKDLYFITPD